MRWLGELLKAIGETLAPEEKPVVELDQPNPSDWLKREAIKKVNGNLLLDFTKLAEDGTPVETQKTGIICPDCYKPADTVIWGIHKGS